MLNSIALRVPFLQFFYRHLPLCCVMLMVALSLMSYRLFQRDLWTDEAFSASYTYHSSIGALLQDVRKNEETPPVYFIVLWLWFKVVGNGEVALRALSLLWGMGAVAVFAILARRWLAPAEASIAGFVFAVAPVFARYLIEVRGYTMLLFLTVVCIAAFERLYREPENLGALVIYVLLTVGLFLTTYFAAALIVAHNLLWLAMLLRRPVLWRRRLVLWCAGQLGMALIVLPWLPALLYQMQVAPAVSPFQNAQPQHYFWLLLMLLMHVPPTTGWLLLWLLIAVVCWGLIVLGLRASLKYDGGLIVRTFGIPALALFALVLWMHAIGPRYLLTLLPGAVLGLATGWGLLRRWAPHMTVWIGALLVVGMTAYRVSGAGMPTTGNPWSTLIPSVEQQADPAHDLVLLHPPYEQRTFAYYYRGTPLTLLGANDYDDFYATQGHSLSLAWTRDEAAAAVHGHQRVWLFYNSALGAPRLDLPYPMLGRWQADGMELTLYQVPGVN
jgi:4-amino-4-deoxy-L-arabinose transferase-like glycosyltransferase